jgi:hypothetical protein
MIDVDCAVGYTPCLTAADDAGYEIDEAEVVFWGRCPDCVVLRAQDDGVLRAQDDGVLRAQDDGVLRAQVDRGRD